MIITLVGMSGAGKSKLSKILSSELSYQRISCDDLIEERLAPELHSRGIDAVAQWLGLPHSANYAQREQLYLTHEEQTVEEILHLIDSPASHQKNIAIDTTGSLGYISVALLDRLKSLSTVVYLEVSQEKEGTLYERYYKKPKPLIWRGYYQQTSEDTELNLKNSLASLLSSRKSFYQQYADIIVDPQHYIENKNGALLFIERVKSELLQHN